MLRALTPVLLALVLAPPALGGGTSPGFAIGGGGVADPGSAVRYVTLRADGGTVLAAVGKADGIVRSSRLLTGRWGVPLVTFGSITGGLSHDRKVLVVGDTAAQRDRWSPRPGSSSSTRGRCGRARSSSSAAISRSTRSRRTAPPST
jgi:hypothetical protein